MRNFLGAVTIGRGKNVSGVYIADGGYILVYAQKDNLLYEIKYNLGAAAPSDMTGSPVSYAQALSRSGALRVEYSGGRLVN